MTAAASRPRIAAIAPVPTGTASCIAWARKRTSGSASAKLSAPAATSAALCSATTAAHRGRGSPPSRLADRHRFLHRLARKRTSGNASAKLSTPARQRAVLAERMAGDDGGRRLRSRRARRGSRRSPAVSITGWVFVVRSSCSFGPSRIRRPTSRSSAADGLVERLPHRRVVAPGVEHADRLRALAGKDESERSHSKREPSSRAAPRPR